MEVSLGGLILKISQIGMVFSKNDSQAKLGKLDLYIESFSTTSFCLLNFWISLHIYKKDVPPKKEFMDLALRYPILVQVITRNDRDVFYGCVPDFGIETYEVVDPGNVPQEYMFHVKLRRMIREAIAVCHAEEKELPIIHPVSILGYSSPALPYDNENQKSSSMISTTLAAQMLGVHADTIRSLFDSGVLKGSLTQGGQRMILISSIQEEEAQRTQRAELRKLELRAKMKNSKRKQRRIQQQKKEKLERFQATMTELTQAET